MFRFDREYFDGQLEKVGYIPLCLVKEVDPERGIIHTWDEYDVMVEVYNTVVRDPPFRFANTFCQINELPKKEFDVYGKVTEKQQKLFESEMHRVIESEDGRI